MIAGDGALLFLLRTCACRALIFQALHLADADGFARFIHHRVHFDVIAQITNDRRVLLHIEDGPGLLADEDGCSSIFDARPGAVWVGRAKRAAGGRCMKLILLSLPCFLSLAANCALYGWLESTVNMTEGLGQLFAPGATTVLFAPFLLLFIGLSLLVFVAAPMLAATAGAAFGALILRRREFSLPPTSARAMVASAVLCHVVVIGLAARYDSAWLLHRPAVRPKTPASVLVAIAGADAALNSLVAAFTMRRLIAKR